ncbi:MAG: nitronate monooxygenase, partial [Moorellaceae bacterium]
MWRTPLCDLLDIRYPILQGGMAWVATGELAAAVSEAGGLGIIGAGNAPPEEVRREIRKVRERTDRPFGVNLYYLSPYIEELVDLVVEEKVPVVTTGAG